MVKPCRGSVECTLSLHAADCIAAERGGGVAGKTKPSDPFGRHFSRIVNPIRNGLRRGASVWSAAEAMAGELASQRVYWSGAHATLLVSGRPFGSPLGKLHSEVRRRRQGSPVWAGAAQGRPLPPVVREPLGTSPLLIAVFLTWHGSSWACAASCCGRAWSCCGLRAGSACRPPTRALPALHSQPERVGRLAQRLVACTSSRQDVLVVATRDPADRLPPISLPAPPTHPGAGADFPAAGPGLPRVRQLPQRCSAVLDDKARLAQCLEAAGCAGIAPRTWTDLDAFLQQHSSVLEQRSGAGSGACAGSAAAPAGSGICSQGLEAAAPLAASGKEEQDPAAGAAGAPAAGHSQLWFLKHRHGVKGRSVYPFTSLPSLLARLRSLSGSQEGGGSGREGGSSSQSACGAGQPGRSGGSYQPGSSQRHGSPLQQFVVQEGAAPPLLLPDGRKFTLRAHVLLLLEQPAGAGGTEAAPSGGKAALSPQRERQGSPGAQPPAEPPQQAELQQAPQGPHLWAWVHEDIIVTPHSALAAAAGAAAAGPAGEADVAVHVSSRGRGHPTPFLLSQLVLEPQQPLPLAQLAQQQQHQRQQEEAGQPAEAADPAQEQQQLLLRQELWEQICSASRAAVAAGAQQGLVPREVDPCAVLYHLWAFDFAVASKPADEPASPAGSGPSNAAPGAAQWGGQRAPPQAPPPRPHVLLLEANSYPAIASGTMAAVPRGVYTRLIGDLLSLVVLPALGGGSSERPGEGAAGGFVRVL